MSFAAFSLCLSGTSPAQQSSPKSVQALPKSVGAAPQKASPKGVSPKSVGAFSKTRAGETPNVSSKSSPKAVRGTPLYGAVAVSQAADGGDGREPAAISSGEASLKEAADAAREACERDAAARCSVRKVFSSIFTEDMGKRKGAVTVSCRCGVAMAVERNLTYYGSSDKILYVVTGAGTSPDMAAENTVEYCESVLQEGKLCRFLKPVAAACNEW